MPRIILIIVIIVIILVIMVLIVVIMVIIVMMVVMIDIKDDYKLHAQVGIRRPGDCFDRRNVVDVDDDKRMVVMLIIT